MLDNSETQIGPYPTTLMSPSWKLKARGTTSAVKHDLGWHCDCERGLCCPSAKAKCSASSPHTSSSGCRGNATVFCCTINLGCLLCLLLFYVALVRIQLLLSQSLFQIPARRGKFVTIVNLQLQGPAPPQVGRKSNNKRMQLQVMLYRAAMSLPDGLGR